MSAHDIAARIQAFAERVEQEYRARMAREYPAAYAACPDNYRVSVKPGAKYTKVDVGGSGRYMVVNATGEIFGIKAYGVIHRGHFYGTVDTIDAWNWGDYAAHLKGA